MKAHLSTQVTYCISTWSYLLYFHQQKDFKTNLQLPWPIKLFGIRVTEFPMTWGRARIVRRRSVDDEHRTFVDHRHEGDTERWTKARHDEETDVGQQGHHMALPEARDMCDAGICHWLSVSWENFWYRGIFSTSRIFKNIMGSDWWSRLAAGENWILFLLILFTYIDATKCQILW